MKEFTVVQKLCILVLFNQVIQSVHVKKCQSNEVIRYAINRKPICCFPIKCEPGQRFDFCSQDQGHDTCQNCPADLTHYDKIDTAQWKYKIDPCIVEVEDCKDYSDLTRNEDTGQCECDRSRGYYGHDRNKCSVDDGTCKKAGHMLALDGECQECGNDYFKDEEGKYRLCKEKTRCTNEQEVADPGSPSRDRTCRAKPSLIMSTVLPNTTSSAANKTRFNTEKRNISDGDGSFNERDSIQNTKDEASPDPEKEQNSDNNTMLIAVTVSGSIVFLIIIVVCVCYSKGKTKGHRNNGANSSLISCCNFYKEVNLKANNLLLGNNNSVRTDQPGVDAEREVDDGTALEEVEERP